MVNIHAWIREEVKVKLVDVIHLRYAFQIDHKHYRVIVDSPNNKTSFITNIYY